MKLPSTLVVAILAATPLIADDPPNVIVIFTDDQGYQDLGCFGSTTIKTPNLDRMSAEGLRLTNFYAQPVCGVSRAALMTGSYPIRIAEPGNLKRLHSVPHPKEWTMAEMFKEAGYATALIGKWHLGRRAKTPSGFDPETMPNGQGFDYFYGTPMFNGLTTFVEEHKFRSSILRNDQVVTQSVESWDSITADYTKEATAWIQKHKDERFFLYLAHNMPHVPLGASTSFKGESKYGPYGDTIEEIDWSCGEIFAKIKSLGLDDNTLVVFTSDNGPWVETTRGMKPGAAEYIPRDHSGTADPFRGWKMSAWDGGSRVPCIIRWPTRIAEGRESDEILSTMDLLPTFASLVDFPIPETLHLDGLNSSDFLLGKSDESPRDEYLYYTGCQLTAVRTGDWKLVLPRPENPPGTGWWGRMIEAIPQTQLFNIKNDPGESNDVAAKHPDVVRRMMTVVESARQSLGDIDRVGSQVRMFDNGPRRLEFPVNPTSSNSKAVGYDNAQPVGKLRFTFENEKWEGWKVIEGSLPEALTNRKDLPGHLWQPFNKQGRWFIFTAHRNGQRRADDSQTGVIRSPDFVLKGNRISFLIGGGSGPETYVALCDADGTELMKAHGKDGPAMHRIIWDVTDRANNRLHIRIVDNSNVGWGHITFDDFSCEGEFAQ